MEAKNINLMIKHAPKHTVQEHILHVHTKAGEQ